MYRAWQPDPIPSPNASRGERSGNSSNGQSEGVSTRNRTIRTSLVMSVQQAGIATHLIHFINTPPINTPCQCTLSTHPINTPCQHMRTYPTHYSSFVSHVGATSRYRHTIVAVYFVHFINTPCQCTLSIHPINTPCHCTLSVNTREHTLLTIRASLVMSVQQAGKTILSAHPTNIPLQHTPSIHPVNTPYQHILSTHPIIY